MQIHGMKRLFYILLTVLCCTLMTAAALIALARSGRVQTAMVQMLTEELSRGLHADVKVESVKFRFFNKLDVQGLYISDQTGDTLLWMPATEVAFNPFTLEENRLTFPSILIDRPYVNIKQDSLSTNLDFILRAFAPQEPSAEPVSMAVNMDRIDIRDARIRYRHLPSDRDLLVSRVNLTARLPLISADTVEAELTRLRLRAQLNGVDAYIDGEFHGSADTVSADNLEVHYRGQRLLLGSASIANPLVADSMRTLVDCRDLYCNQPLLQDLLADILRKPVRLPQEVRRLGEIHYKGTLSGGLDDLQLHGAFITDAGTVSTDCTVSTDTTFSDIRLRGKVSTRRFHLGKVLKGYGLGNLSMAAEVDTRYRKDMPFFIKGKANIQALTYRAYTYRNLRIDGQFADSVFNGSMHINDDNLAFALNGVADFSTEAPMADINLVLEHLRLHELHLAENLHDQDLQLRSNISFTTGNGGGHWLDRLNGHILTDSVIATNNGEEVRLKELKILIDSDKKTSLRIQSDFLNAGMSGTYSWTSLPATFANFAHELFPTSVPARPKPRKPNDFEFYCYMRELDSLLQFAGSSMYISLPPTVKGHVRESEEEYELQLYVPSVEKGNAELKDITLFAGQRRKEGLVALSMTEHTIDLSATQLKLGDIAVSMTTHARNDSLLTALRFDDADNIHDNSRIDIHTHIGKYARKPFVSVHILPSVFYLRDTAWTTSDAMIEYAAADTILSVNGFGIQSDSQHIRAHGTASASKNDSIHIALQNINLDYFMQYLGLEKSLSAEGSVSGWATLYGLFGTPVFEADVEMPDARLNHTSIGRLKAKASLENGTNHVLIAADAVQDGRHIVHLDGNVIPEDKYWELFIHADSADISLVNFWTQGMLQDITGRGYGDVHVFGRRMDTWVTAQLLAKDAALTIPYTGARYYLSDSVILDTTRISFPHVRIRDAQGNTGMVKGELTHELFKNFKYHITADVTDILALDIPYSSQAMFYGKAYATGHVEIKGDEQLTRIDVSAATRKNTDFYVCVNTASDARDNSFIEFIDKTPPAPTGQQHKRRKNKKKDTVAAPAAKLLLSLQIEATPDATVNVTLDPHSGDGITGRGEGSLRLLMDGDNDVQLFGTYSLLSGKFSYALGNIIRRDFTIAEGSSISWAGNPLTPTLNVTAKYRVTASLKDLFGKDISSLATNRSSVPVECMLYITDRLLNPTLRFGIELPQSDEAVASQVKSVINSDEMLMRQVVYLLVFNRFFTPEYLQNTTVAANETYSLLSSTVTGQINSWLSRLTDVVSVGFNFRTDGEGANSSQEYETQFRIQPVNRLSINGNVGYRYNDLSNRPFFGDVDIEYELTPDGKLRARAFTHTVDKYSLKQASTVQGVGFIFRHDFNAGDAKRQREARKQKKETQQNDK